MENKVTNKDKKFEELSTRWQELSNNFAIISAAIQYKKSQEKISQKVDNENRAITYNINLINKKVLENPKKYAETEREMSELMDRYKTNLTNLAESLDSQIVQGYVKILEEENRQNEMHKQIYELLKEEKVVKKKLDNSDDDIREKICDIEDEISKSELKIRRYKPTIRKKIEEKENKIANAMESKEQQVQRDVKTPKVFAKATRFFLGRINPHKMIEKNVFSSVKTRIEIYEKEEKVNVKKPNPKYNIENILDTINEVSKDKI